MRKENTQMSGSILFRKEEAIAFIKMNRPGKLNALTSAMLDDIMNALVEAELDNQVRVIVISGGEKSFCAGADIDEEKGMTASDALQFGLKGQRVCTAVQVSMKPVIAAISGYALGGGLELALACDFRISSSEGIFGFPEVTLGVTTGWGGAANLVKIAGPSKAKELLMVGKTVGTEEAYRLGIINETVQPDQVMISAIEFAKKLSSLPASSLAMAKALVNRYSESLSPKDLFLEAVGNAYCYSLEEKAKAYEAFLSRKKKDHKGGN
jgi:enoyl-CoA hydratase/carnithine racemase